MAAEADAIERAVDETLKAGIRCGDIMRQGCKLVGCREMGAEIRSRIRPSDCCRKTGKTCPSPVRTRPLPPADNSY